MPKPPPSAAAPAPAPSPAPRHTPRPPTASTGAPTLPAIHDARSAWSPADSPLPPIDQLANVPPRRHSAAPPPFSPAPRPVRSPSAAAHRASFSSFSASGSPASAASAASAPVGPALPLPHGLPPLAAWGERPLPRPHRWSDDLPQARRSFVRANLLATVAEASGSATPVWSGASTPHTQPHYPPANQGAPFPAPTGTVSPTSSAPPAPGPGTSQPSVLREVPPSFPGTVDGWDMPFVPQRGKRKRSQRSCTSCHKAKRRCDRKHPCGNCTFNGKVCQYYDEAGVLTTANQPKQRDSMPSSYIVLPPTLDDSGDDEVPLRKKWQARSFSVGQVGMPMPTFGPHYPQQPPPRAAAENSGLVVLAEAAAPSKPAAGATPPLSVFTPPSGGERGGSSIVPPLVGSLSSDSRSSRSSLPSLGEKGGEAPPSGAPPASESAAGWTSALPSSVEAGSIHRSTRAYGCHTRRRSVDGVESALRKSAIALLPAASKQEELLTQFKAHGFPLALCLPPLSKVEKDGSKNDKEGGYIFDAEPALQHALFAAALPPEGAAQHAQAARFLLALSPEDPFQPLTYALLALTALASGQAHQAVLDTTCAWRLIEAGKEKTDKLLSHAVAAVDGVACLYAGLHPSVPASALDTQSSELEGALAALTQALTLRSREEMDKLIASLPSGLGYSDAALSALIQAGEAPAPLTRQSMEHIAWACLHAHAAAVQLGSGHAPSVALARGRIATLKAGLDVFPPHVAGPFFLAPLVALDPKRKPRGQADRMALQTVERWAKKDCSALTLLSALPRETPCTAAP